MFRANPFKSALIRDHGRKPVFSTLFIILCVMLALLPFINSFQDVLTRIVLHFELYRSFQELVVPYELKILATLLNLVNIPTRSGAAYIMYMKDSRPEVIYLAWNCIGWQSFIFLLITLISGLSGRFTRMSKLEALIIGILGTFIVNMLRLTLVVVMYYLTGRGFGLVFHNYFSNLLSILWLFVFWWIAYTFVLEHKGSTNNV